LIAGWINEILKLKVKSEKLKKIRNEVKAFLKDFPI